MRLIICFFVSGFLGYCSNAPENSYAPDASTQSEYAEEAYDSDYESNGELAFNQEEDETEERTKKTQDQRKIIRTADIYMEVEKYRSSNQQLREIITQYDGFIASESEDQSDYRLQNRYVIKLKPEKLDQFIAAAEKIALSVENKTVSSKDVTREYIDLETRLQSKREVVERYRDILKSAQSIPDILEIEEKMRVVIEEIESAEGQLRYLKNQVQFSTVNLTLYEQLQGPISSGRSFTSRLGRSLKTGVEVLQELILGLVSIWPILIGVGVGVFFWRRRKKRKKLS